MKELLPKGINKKQAVLLFIVFLVCNWCLYLFINFMFVDRHKTECGVIIKKYTNNDIHHHKHSTSSSINMYFDMKFDNGKYEQINVNSDTYYKNQEGGRVCFIRDIERKTTFFVIVFIIVGYLTGAIEIIGFVALIVFVIRLFWKYLGKE